MGKIFELLNEKYDLNKLLCGDLDIDEVLSDVDIVDFLSCSEYGLIDIEDYILKNIH